MILRACSKVCDFFISNGGYFLVIAILFISTMLMAPEQMNAELLFNIAEGLALVSIALIALQTWEKTEHWKAKKEAILTLNEFRLTLEHREQAIFRALDIYSAYLNQLNTKKTKEIAKKIIKNTTDKLVPVFIDMEPEYKNISYALKGRLLPIDLKNSEIFSRQVENGLRTIFLTPTGSTLLNELLKKCDDVNFYISEQPEFEFKEFQEKVTNISDAVWSFLQANEYAKSYVDDLFYHIESFPKLKEHTYHSFY